MAVSQVDKTLNLCSRLAKAADTLMIAIEQLDSLLAQKEDSEIDLKSVVIEDALSTSSLKHADGDVFNAVLSSGSELRKWLRDNGHEANFQKARP